jgi:hypothetical protein
MQDDPMLNWYNTTLDIVRAFKNFHATRLPAFQIASGEQQVDVLNMTSSSTPRYVGLQRTA